MKTRLYAIGVCINLLCANSIVFAEKYDLIDVEQYPYEDFMRKDAFVPGKIPGTFSVSHDGSANYTIPIEIPQGTGSLTPQLSVNYNSRGGDGIMGWGFSLGGLSRISRSNGTRITDGKVQGVDLTSKDYLALDGNRLVRCGENFYTLELHESSLIETDDKANPTWFKVQKGDGSVFEYGTTSDSRVYGQGADSGIVVFWLLNRVTDASGNYYTFSYDQDTENGGYYISRIDYSGNDLAGVAPSRSIRFEYTPRKDTNILLHGHSIFQTNRLLNMIKMYAGDDCVRYYTFAYNTIRYTKLGSIYSFGPTDGDRYRPTILEWDSMEWPTIADTERIDEEKVYNCDVYTGDFNGDGKSDFVVVPHDGAGWNEWRLFLSEGFDGTFSFAGSGPIQAGLKSLIIGDFNGDGLDDMIQVRSVSGDFTNYFMYYATGSGFEQYGTSAFSTFSVANGALPGDFNGDGICDLAIYFPGTTRVNIYASSVDAYGAVTPFPELPSSAHKSWYALHNWDQPYLGDFNGDGITDILNCHSSGYDMLCMQGVYGPNIYTDRWPTSSTKLTSGDFNGDGKTDFIVGTTRMLYSTGIRFISNDIQYADRIGSKQLFTADLNGDGKDDFYAVPYESTGNLEPLKYYINDGDGLSFTECTGPKTSPLSLWKFTPADFNGDGLTDILRMTTWDGKPMVRGYMTYMVSAEGNKLLRKITDGMECVTEIDYGSTADREVHEQKNSTTYPVRPIKSPMTLVSEVRQSNGIGGFNTIGYKYYGGKYHVQGRGFLGFDAVEEMDYANNTVTTSTYEVERRKYLTALVSREVNTIDGAPISKDEYVNELQYNYGSRLRPVISVAKSYDAPSGEVFKTITTRDGYDDYGNNTFHSEKYNDADSITYRTKYANTTYDVIYSGKKWLLGLPTESYVVYTRNGSEIKHTTTCEYAEESPQLKSKSVSYGTDLTVTESYKYDVCGNMIEKTETAAGESRTSKVEYDANYCLKTKYTDPQGYYSEYVHDPKTGAVTWEKGADGLESYFDNDAFGHQTHKRQKHASEVNVTRWSDNMPMAPTNAAYFTYAKKTGEAPVLEFYDQFGRKLRTVGMQANNHCVYTDMVYNAAGLLASQSEPYFLDDTPRWHIFRYDEQQRRVAEEFPDGTTETIEYSIPADSQMKTEKYDRLSNSTATVVNCHDEVIESSDGTGGRVRFEYNPMGHCICATGENSIVRMEYDAVGRRVSLVDLDAGAYGFVYNGFGDLIRYDNIGLDTQIKFEVDAIGRVKRRTDSDGETIYTYDSQRLGLLKSAENGGSIMAYDYDEANRIYHEVKYINWDEYYLWYSYNSLNQLESILYPNLKKAVYHYERNGFVTDITFEGEQIWSLNDVNAKGAITKAVLGNGLTIERSFDPVTGLLTSIDNGGLTKYSYDFDPLGNLLSRTDEKRNLTERFFYDTRYSLTGIEMDDGASESITYDNAGNIVSSSLGDFHYEMRNRNHLTRISSESELIDPITSIYYTSYHKVESIQKSGTFPNVLDGLRLINITYGPDQQRDMMIVNHDTGASLDRFGFTKKYINRYYETSSSKTAVGTVDSQTCYIYAGNELVAIADRTKTDSGSVENLSYVHTDHLGSIIGYSDTDGNLVAEFSYDAWGRFRNCDTWEIESNPRFHDRGFCGHEHIGSFGLINMNGRIYDQMTCRFISPDPYVQMPENPLNMNRYAYCLNNPLKYRDDTGELFLIDDFVFGFWRGIFTGKNPFKTGWQSTKNSFNIWKGLFSLDSNKSFWGRVGEFFSRFTYQLPQTALGLFSAHGYNMFGSVEKVKSLYGATVLTTHNMKGTSAMTLGSFIIGNSGTYADPNNATFQHEYGHYLQSQAMGWAYLSKVGLPSLFSAAGSGDHKYKPFELDANYRAFNYFNKNVPGFYKSRESKGNYGWDFQSHPLGVKGSASALYLDYNDSDAMEQARKSLSISAGWYHYIFPFVSTIFDH